MKRGSGLGVRIAVATIVGSTLVPCVALGNGRFPAAQALESVPNDPTHLFLRTTFGMLASHDGGARWRWICERAMGFEGVWDPPIAVSADGRLWIGLEDGLVSTQDGCSFERAEELEGHTVKDLTVDEPRGAVWAITGAPGRAARVWRRDRRSAFVPLATLGETNLMTIEVAPSDSKRVYLTGQPYTTIRGQVFRSNDGGRSFVSETNSLSADGPLFLAAVDPKDASRVLLRHLHAKGSAVVLSRDAGLRFEQKLFIESAMFGWAKDASGQTYFAGSGLAEHGVYRSVDRGEHFEPVAKTGVLCLHSAYSLSVGNMLFACENSLGIGDGAVFAKRSLDRGETFVPFARFGDIEGPVECPATSPGARQCEAIWPQTRALLSPARRPSEVRLDDAGPLGSESTHGPARPSCRCDLVGRAVNEGCMVQVSAWAAAGLFVMARVRRRAGSSMTHARPRSRSFRRW